MLECERHRHVVKRGKKVFSLKIGGKKENYLSDKGQTLKKRYYKCICILFAVIGYTSNGGIFACSLF